MLWSGKSQSDLRPWIANADAELVYLRVAGQAWPVTLGRTHRSPHATWLTSFVSATISTPHDEIVNDSWRSGVSKVALRCLREVAWAIGVDQAAIVNNALLSVSLLGPSQVHSLRLVLQHASQQWSDRYVVVRGIVANSDALADLARNVGGVLLPNRLSYVFDLSDGQSPTKINAQRDFKLLTASGLDVVDHDKMGGTMLDAAHQQYLDVYVGRHGERNPQLTAQFFHDLHIARAAEFIGLARDGRLAAFAALRHHDDFYSVPLIGYDVNAPQRDGLYRQIFALALRTAAQRRVKINFGAGAAQYKTLRGATQSVEYMVIIPPRRGLSASVIGACLRYSEKPLARVVPQLITAHGG